MMIALYILAGLVSYAFGAALTGAGLTRFYLARHARAGEALSLETHSYAFAESDAVLLASLFWPAAIVLVPLYIAATGAYRLLISSAGDRQADALTQARAQVHELEADVENLRAQLAEARRKPPELGPFR